VSKKKNGLINLLIFPRFIFQEQKKIKNKIKNNLSLSQMDIKVNPLTGGIAFNLH